MKKRAYDRPTTASQRRILFEMWEATKNVKQACQKARVSERTFYYWRPRFEAGGYEALEKPKSAGRPSGSVVSEEIKAKVIATKQAQPKWGKERIAQELGKQNGWVALVSPNTVRRILQEADLWPKQEERGEKKDR